MCPPTGRTLALLELGLLLLLAVLTWQVVVDGVLLEVDDAVRDAVRGRGDRGSPAGRTAELLADLGNATVAGPVLAAAAGWATWWWRRAGARWWWVPAAGAAAVGAAVPALVVPMKVLVGRGAPGGGALGPEQLGLFPSGHAATAAVCLGAAVLLAPVRPRGVRWAVVVLNVGVGAGLVCRGYHWLWDVVAAWALATMVLLGLAATLARAGRDVAGPGAAGPPGAGRDGWAGGVRARRGRRAR